MDAHFRNSFAYQFAIAEITQFSRTDAMDDPGASHSVLQTAEPSVKFLGAQKGVHVPKCIRSDTEMQSCMRVERARCEMAQRGNSQWFPVLAARGLPIFRVIYSGYQ